VQIYDVFDNNAQADAFRDKYGPGISLDIYKAETNKWVLIETNEECLDKVKFYDKENEILENMINQTKKDAEICREMLERRKTQAVQNNPTPVDKQALDQYLSATTTHTNSVRDVKQQLFDINDDQHAVFFDTKK
jgi:hypothetical protein